LIYVIFVFSGYCRRKSDSGSVGAKCQYSKRFFIYRIRFDGA